MDTATPPSPAPCPTPSEDPKGDQILAAAKAIFLEQGYSGAAMDVVAQRARVSKTTLYTRFPSKEALFSATIEAECRRRGMDFRAEAFDGLTLTEALTAIGRRFVDLIWSPEAVRMHQVVVGEAARFPEVARLFFEAGPVRARHGVAAYIARAAERGLAAIADPAFAGSQFLASLQGGAWCELICNLRPCPDPAEREAFVRDAVRLFVDGLQAPLGDAAAGAGPLTQRS